MHRKSFFNLTVDFEKSFGSYFVDKPSGRQYLDFFGLYASNALGYNHPIFDDHQFQKDLISVSKIKLPLNEVITEAGETFLSTFRNWNNNTGFENYHFTCTGSLAVEAAIKAAIDQKQIADPVVLSLKESFHGINGYGGFVTDRFYPASLRLDGFLDMKWPKLSNPKITPTHPEGDISQFVADFEKAIATYGNRVIAIVVEPIQSTAGDHHFSPQFFETVSRLCQQHQVIWIQDEIQTGMGITGKRWVFEHFEFRPDIVCFGKKVQAGIMTRPHIDAIFNQPIRLEVTFDGDLVDMLRSTYILKAIDQHHLIQSAEKKGEKLKKALADVDGLVNVRGRGLLVAFDCPSELARDQFVKTALDHGLLTSRAGENTIRLRPNLAVSDQELDQGITCIKKTAKTLLHPAT